MRTDHLINRRGFIQGLALGGAALYVPGAFAEELSVTPAMTEGPFYPDKLPLDTDNDLIIVNDKLTPAVGEVTHLTGRVLTTAGSPVRNATVEIWQVDGKGVYLHSRSSGAEKRDANFQGYGRFLTDSKGRYYFRTVKPVPYPGRTPHIHFIVKQGEKKLVTSQIFIKGFAQNQRDGLFQRVRDAKLLVADFKPMKDSKTKELAANFDIIVGVTPEMG